MARKPKPPKKRDFKAEYERRIRNATAKGRTRQQARGHVEAEHIARAEREIEERGITGAQEKTVTRWYEGHYNPRGYPDAARADLEDVLELVRTDGYSSFTQWRHVWDAARRTYLREQAEGMYASRGEGYLVQLTSQAGVAEVSWLYYH